MIVLILILIFPLVLIPLFVIFSILGVVLLPFVCIWLVYLMVKFVGRLRGKPNPEGNPIDRFNRWLEKQEKILNEKRAKGKLR